MFTTFDGIVTEGSELQPENAPLLMSTTLDGIVTEDSELQPENA